MSTVDGKCTTADRDFRAIKGYFAARENKVGRLAAGRAKIRGDSGNNGRLMNRSGSGFGRGFLRF